MHLSRICALVVKLLVLYSLLLPFSIASAAPSNGSEGATFTTNIGTGFNGSVFSITALSTGKILIGGSFDTFNGNTRNRIVRLNADGTEDTAFYTTLGTAFDNVVRVAHVFSDGKMLIGGEFALYNGASSPRLIKLNTDGTKDTSFATLFEGGHNGDVKTLAIQSDNKIIVGGAFTRFNGLTRNYLIRLNADGTEDTTFSSNLGTAFNDYVFKVVLLSNGKILVGGGFTTLDGVTRNRLVLLNSDGTVDTTFYSNLGTGFGDFITDIDVQSDGKFLISGELTTLNGNARVGLVRLNSDGTEDTSFATGMGAGLNGQVKATAIQSDGAIIIGGSFTTVNGVSRNYITRINSTGSEDTSFGTAMGTSFDDYPQAITLLSNDSIIVGGDFSTFKGNTRGHIVFFPSSATTYTVTYSGNTSTGGSVPTDSSSPYSSGATVTVLGNTGSLTRNGYTFNNWNTASDGTGTSYNPAATFSITTNTTLYAQWAAASTSGSNGPPVPIGLVCRDPKATNYAGQFAVGLSFPSLCQYRSSEAPGVVTAPGCTLYLTSFILPGMKNNKADVRRLQAFLNNHGEHLTIDGTYDAADIAAVKRFQKKYDRETLSPWGHHIPTGRVYTTTQKRINTMYCAEK